MLLGMKRILWLMLLTGFFVTSVDLASAEEKLSVVQTALSSTTLSGYVDASATWHSGNTVATVTSAPEKLIDENRWWNRFCTWIRSFGFRI